MSGFEIAGLITVAIVLALLLFAIFKIPVKLVFKLILNTLVGFAALFLINLAGGLIGIAIAVNWLNAVIVGIFGVPGIALALLLQWLAVV